MSKRGSGRIGDVAQDFLTAWASLKGDAGVAVPTPHVPSSVGRKSLEGDPTRKIGHTANSWKKGGSPVDVTNVSRRQNRNGQKPIRVWPVKPKGGSSGFHPLEQSANKKLAFVDKPPANSTEISPGPTGCKTVVPPKLLTAAEKLRAESADVLALGIRGSTSRAVPHAQLPPIVEDDDANLAILGLDFGTAFTKAVIRWKSDHYVVDWTGIVESEVSYLLPSIFSESVDAECVLGQKDSDGWVAHDGIKLPLIESKEACSLEELADAVVFLALVFRYANQWLRKTRTDGKTAIRWQMHLGLPALSWDDEGKTAIFRKIGQAARILAFSDGHVSRYGAIAALQDADDVKRPAVDVFPEFACQLIGYLRSQERQQDLHALVDVGAGTLDVAFFNVHEHEGAPVLPIFSASVEKLGAHYLIAALAGSAAKSGQWKDSDAALEDKQVASLISQEEIEVANRRRLFLSTIADLFHRVQRDARLVYDNSPAFKQGVPIRLFVCGGGGRIRCIRDHFVRIAKESEPLLGVKLHVSSLVRPSNLRGHFGDDFDRLSVAYGLSQVSANIGDVLRTGSLAPLLPQPPIAKAGRDDDR